MKYQRKTNMGSTNKMYGLLYSSLVSCLCTISCIHVHSTTFNKTPQLIERYYHSILAPNENNESIIDLQQALGVKYDSLLLFDGWDLWSTVWSVTGCHDIGPKKDQFIGAGGWYEDITYLVLMKNGTVLYDDAFTWEKLLVEDSDMRRTDAYGTFGGEHFKTDVRTTSNYIFRIRSVDGAYGPQFKITFN